MSILSVDTIQPIGSGTTITLNAAKIVVGTGITFESNGQAIYAGIITATSFSGSGANLTNLPAGNLTGTLPAISGANLTSLPAQATIANNADNRIITGGSGVNLNGEANLTFDSSNRFTIGSANPMAATDYGTAKINGSAGGVVAFSVGDTQKWEVYGNAAQLQIYDRANTKYNTKFKAGGNVEITDGNLVLASGHGIDFSATANSSGSMSNELLDDYEEGSFTPTITRQHNSPIIGYDAQDGYYTKIGRVVYFYAEVRINSYNGNGSYGLTYLDSLPFTSAARTGGRGVWNSVTYHSYYRDMTTTDGEKDIAVVAGSESRVTFYIQRSENSWATPPAPDANDQFKIGGFYFT